MTKTTLALAAALTLTLAARPVLADEPAPPSETGERADARTREHTPTMDGAHEGMEARQHGIDRARAEVLEHTPEHARAAEHVGQPAQERTGAEVGDAGEGQRDRRRDHATDRSQERAHAHDRARDRAHDRAQERAHDRARDRAHDGMGTGAMAGAHGPGGGRR